MTEDRQIRKPRPYLKPMASLIVSTSVMFPVLAVLAVLRPGPLRDPKVRFVSLMAFLIAELVTLVWIVRSIRYDLSLIHI